jgi:hypothetical protein
MGVSIKTFPYLRWGSAGVAGSLIGLAFVASANVCPAQTPGARPPEPVIQAPAPAAAGPASSASFTAIAIPDAPAATASLGGAEKPALIEAPAPAKNAPVMINGRPYTHPTAKEQFDDYARNTYGLPALAFTSVRAAVSQGRGKPEEWGQDWPGFGQRFGSASAVTVIDGNVRYGMEMLFKEDMRYIPCHGCSVKRKFENALLAEVTARHDSDGHRFFTLTPTVTDMTGPIIANSVWIPGHTAIDGFTGSRLIFAYRIAGHLFTEFVWERRHHDPPLPD